MSSANAKLNQVLQRLAVIGEQIGEQVKSVDDHEARLRVLEEFRGRLIGAVVLVSALFSGLGAWLGVLASHR